MDVRRISVFGGPGSGKSTLAARVFGELKTRGYDVEHVPEFIKGWAYEGRKPISYDQHFVYASQEHDEDVKLRFVKVIVSDSPLLMNAAYSAFYGFRNADLITEMAKRFEEDFPSVNFLIKRTVDYVDTGRYQDLSEAVSFDKHLEAFLTSHLHRPLKIVTIGELDRILEIIEPQIAHAKIGGHDGR